MAESCQTCRFWRGFLNTLTEYGMCRRRSPPLYQFQAWHHDQWVEQDGEDPRLMFWEHPVTDAEDWCGEYAAAKGSNP